MITLTNKEYDKLIKLAYYDNLTNCYNRNWFFENYSDGSEFIFVVIDINNLKSINDKLGHLEGDRIIISIANHLMTFGNLIRFGGDEFILILPMDFNVKQLDDKRYCYGFSVKTKNEKLADVMDKADKWMYRFKHKLNKSKCNKKIDF